MIIFSPGLYCCHHPLPEAAQDVAEVPEEQGKGQEGGEGGDVNEEE